MSPIKRFKQSQSTWMRASAHTQAIGKQATAVSPNVRTKKRTVNLEIEIEAVPSFPAALMPLLPHE